MNKKAISPTQQVSLTEEELEVINNFRTEKSKREAAEKSSKLEKEFRKVCSQALKKINVQLELVNTALEEAAKISEEYGIPFQCQINRTDYVPSSLFEKWTQLDLEYVRNYCNLCSLDSGWNDWTNEALWSSSSC